MVHEPRFFDKMDQLDAAMSRYGGAPSALSDVAEYLTDCDIRREFFKRLQNPEWIPSLEEAGYFKSPTEVKRLEGGGVQYMRWPAADYLARMASQAPEQVAAILAEVQTDNPSVVGDMVKASLEMPAKVAISLVPNICQAARAGTLWIHFKDASALCVRLAEGGEINEALSLADALFSVKFKEGDDVPPRLDEYWYKDGLKKVVPVLATASAREFLRMLCEWLKATVEAKGNTDVESGSDYSDVWRPAIEEHEQNRDYDFAGAIVGYVREGFELAIEAKSLSLDESLQILEKHPYLVFRRIQLHLIGEFAEQNPEFVRDTMLDRSLFEDYGCKHEHARLLGKRFGMLDSDQQAQWLQWVQEIPTAELKEVLSDPGDPDASQRYRDYWRFERLHWVRDYLTGGHKEFYEQMLAQCGEPDMADLNFRSGSPRWGSESPMTVDELQAGTFEDAVKAVSEWEPRGNEFMGPNIEGLASTFGQYVGTNPEQFSREAHVLVGRPSPFVRRFITQMREAVSSGREIDLSGVLKLCQWVISQPVEKRTTPGYEQGLLVDRDWQWTRDEICGFLRTVCTVDSGGVAKYSPEDLREQVWELLNPLCHDRPGSLHESSHSQGDPRVQDYLNFAINTPRGRALETAIEYARWVANHVKQVDGKNEIVPGGFDVMPEVRQMLEWQLAEANKTVEAAAILGARTGLLWWIDKQWLTDKICHLFPLDAMRETPPVPESWAGWNAFLVWSGPHIEFYRALKPQFAHAVEQVGNVESKGGHREEPVRRLGEHLMILYGRGHLALDEDDGLIRRFIANANSALRRHTISFVGQSLDGDAEIPKEVIERFMALWEEYWLGFGMKDAAEKPDTWLFGWWFSCGRFPEQWALEQLEKFVEVSSTPEPDHAIMKKLAEIAHFDIARSVRILDSVFRGDKEGWRISSCADQAKAILGEAMKDTGEAKEKAVALINYLGRRGFTDFGKLLKV